MTPTLVSPASSDRTNPAPDSTVEKLLAEQGYFDHYDDEKIAVLQFNSLSELGRAVTYRFIEWVQRNPRGVCSLPTGKTPEYFIRWMNHLLEHWDTPEIAQQVEAAGLGPERPDMSELYFVQIDDFFPMKERHPNRFLSYIQRHYIKNFGFDRNRALLMDFNALEWPENLSIDDLFPDQSIDLTLRTRAASNDLERLQQKAIITLDSYAMEYEQRIRDLGGIGFFLGGIGPDGHIAFNIRGSDFFSTTRLIHTNFETQAAAASDLGGIEISAKKAVMTIGLGTITYNPDTVAIIMAAGEAKAGVIAEAISGRSGIQNPASILQNLPNARIYLTNGAAIKLEGRRIANLPRTETIDDDMIVRTAIDLSVRHNSRIKDLIPEQIQSDPYGEFLLGRLAWSPERLQDHAHDVLTKRLKEGLAQKEGRRFLHTGPHHDDILLGLLPAIIHQVRSVRNEHNFAIMTSGFTSVPNQVIIEVVKDALECMRHWEFSRRWEAGYFNQSPQELRDRDVKDCLEALIVNNDEERTRAVSRRVVHSLMEIHECTGRDELESTAREVLEDASAQLPGAKDRKELQLLKGAIREFEEDLVWAHYGFEARKIHHLRLAFYTGDYFTEAPTRKDDLPPISALFESLQPDVLTLAYDPEGTGPDTHYKVLQALATYLEDNLEQHRDKLEIWGYRNVWHRFHPGDANMYVPVSANTLATLDHIFKKCYITQKYASFPSYMHDGAFSELMQQIYVEQYDTLRTALGEQFWLEQDNPRLRSTYGLLLVRKMSVDEFLAAAESLRGLIGHT